MKRKTYRSYTYRQAYGWCWPNSFLMCMPHQPHDWKHRKTDPSFFTISVSPGGIINNIIYLYNSLQPKCIHPNLGEQLNPKCSFKKVTNKDCGYFAIIFCISLMFEDDPATLCYNQKEMRSISSSVLK